MNDLRRDDQSVPARSKLPPPAGVGVLAAFPSWLVSPMKALPHQNGDGSSTALKSSIDAASVSLSTAASDERQARSAAEKAKACFLETEVQKKMLQAQVEVSVLAATANGRPSAALSLELESLVHRTRQVEAVLQASALVLREAENAHHR